MGRTNRDHDTNIINLFNVAQKEGLVFNSAKCSIKQGSVTFYGGVFSAHGYSPDLAKIQGITEMTPPQMKQKLQSFLGAVNYLQTFVPHLSHHTEPLQAVLKKENSVHLGWELKWQFPENKVPTWRKYYWNPSGITTGINQSPYSVTHLSKDWEYALSKKVNQ